jgi:hypothetical protein
MYQAYLHGAAMEEEANAYSSGDDVMNAEEVWNYIVAASGADASSGWITFADVSVMFADATPEELVEYEALYNTFADPDGEVDEGRLYNLYMHMASQDDGSYYD